MKKILIGILISILIFANISYAGNANYANLSNWAYQEFDTAVANGIAKSDELDGFRDCKRNITRKEFACLVVNMYFEVTGEMPQPAAKTTFADTQDKSVLMANNLGIVNGSYGKFYPNNSVTRQEMAIMILRAVKALKVEYKAGDGILTVTDKDNVDSWAKDGVDFAYENGFMKGDGVVFSPLATTPIEQAVLIANRVYEKYSGGNQKYTKGYTVSTPEEDSLVVTYNNNEVESLIIAGQGNTLTKIIRAQKSLDGSKIFFSSEDRNNNISGEDIYHYDFKTNKIKKDNFNYDGKAQGFKHKYFNITNDGDIAIVNSDNEHLLFTESGQFVSYIDCAYDETPRKIETQSYAKAWYGKNAIDKSTEKFNLYGETKTKMVQFKDNLTIKPNSKVESINTGTHPLILAADSNGNNIKVPTDSYYSVNMKITKLQHEYGNAGIIFGAEKPSPGINKVKGFVVSISPKRHKVEIGRCNNDWKVLGTFDIPTKVDLSKEIEIYAKVTTAVNKATNVQNTAITLYFNSLPIAKDFVIGTPYDIPAESSFGIKSWAAEVEYTDYKVYGVKTVPRKDVRKDNADTIRLGTGIKQNFLLYGENQTKRIQLEKLCLKAYSTIDSANTGIAPIILAADESYNNIAKYPKSIKTTIKVTRNNKGNAGVVFGVSKAGSGNNYYGYYVGIVPHDRKLTLGSQFGDKWYELKLVDVPSDVNLNDYVDLEVKIVSSQGLIDPGFSNPNYNIEVYINGVKSFVYSLDINDSISKGGFGIRTWNADAEYLNYEIK